jgi:dTDP-4-dehydrorhamnose reductase
MRIAVTGRDGQIARSLAEIARMEEVDVVFLGRPNLDLARPETVWPALRDAGAAVVINAAAYTAVDKAESEPDLAIAVNARGAGAVAAAARRLGLPVLHLSTDYVFDGASRRPYREEDETGPLGVYGRSKLLGEQAVAAANPAHVILRTAWVYSPFGNNFVKTMLRLAATRDEIGVVADQRGCPTSALDIARTLIAVARQLTAEGEGASRLHGIFHMTGQGEAAWSDVAEAIFGHSIRFGGPAARVKRIPSADYPLPAKRPANSRLDGTKLRETYGLTLPAWTDSLETCAGRLLSEAAATPVFAFPESY